MLTPEDQETILRITDQHWDVHKNDQAFTELVRGKEPGHRMADHVDDRTVSLLKVQLDTRYEATLGGRPKLRSMGDVWIQSRGIFNPVNVKSGEQGKQGQPNLVSMQKLLDYIFQRRIDSYYLLIVKFRLSQPVVHHQVYLIDLLDWLDFVAFDAGPGQLMLQERHFYDAIDSGQMPADLTIIEKVNRLFTMFESAVHALFRNRELRLDRQRKVLEEFRDQGIFQVDQSGMVFVP